MPVLNKFHPLLLKKRSDEGRDITLEEIARKIDVSRDTLSRYSAQKITRYDSHIVEAICHYFGVGVEEFLYLGSKDDRQPEAQS